MLSWLVGEVDMKSRLFICCPALATVFFLSIISSYGQTGNDSHSPANRPARVISLSTRNSAFEPATIHMVVNEKVEVDVTGESETLGVRVSPFPEGAKANTPPGLSFLFGEDCYKIGKGQSTPILIEATEPGAYTITCCKNCGAKHKGVVGRIVVTAAP
jgi:heme/copper-type cytochrome/quinol oxidase subunit 2